MLSSYFFLSPSIMSNNPNSSFIDALSNYSNEKFEQIYVIQAPLGENKYSYENTEQFIVVLIPKYKILFINFSDDNDKFNEFCEDLIEDLGSISDKYRYKDYIGRPRSWKEQFTKQLNLGQSSIIDDIESFLKPHYLESSAEQRKCELLISLLTGSINDIENVKSKTPATILDKIKKKIILFDGDQSRFIYNSGTVKGGKIRIQGLSGTGKTELLLHKLKELYTNSSSARIMFTCHNKILAHSLRKRIPHFFNFMKVEEQIEWHDRLWCVHGWGSQFDKNSGAYRYICDFYNIPFLRYNRYNNSTFDAVCKIAFDEIIKISDAEFKYAFDFMLIDESQDFPDSFFKLCQKITSSNVYIAGDVFQSIFDEKIVSEIKPDYLLSKCYRTDPRTLMFAHALGMGLFEKHKLRWLSDEEWEACGYNIKNSGSLVTLTRDPLRRFEDIDNKDFSSMELVPINGLYTDTNVAVIDIIKNLKKEHHTIEPHDIGIIFLDESKNIYEEADILEQEILREFGWKSNKSYETKTNPNGYVFLSNKNNVKGLEFPFVICIGSQLSHTPKFRNSLYTMLTRSFLQTYLVLKKESDQTLLTELDAKLNHINTTGEMIIERPTEDEIGKIRTRITVTEPHESFHEFISGIIESYNISLEQQEAVLEAVKNMTQGKEVFNEKKISGIVDMYLGIHEDP